MKTFTYNEFVLEEAIECAEKVAQTLNKVVYVTRVYGRLVLGATAVDNPIYVAGLEA